MDSPPPLVERFRALHHADGVLLMPNAWDVGSARILRELGFTALATTSSGSAATLGRLDGDLGRDAALRHAADLAAAVDLPVSADLENGFAGDLDGVAETFEAAVATGIAGASVEDWSGERIYPLDVAVDRVRTAVRAADGRLVITARAENHIHGIDDLADTVARLQAFAEAGADVVFAPGLRTAEAIGAVVSSVPVPVSVLILPGVPPVAELAALGVRRVSVGGAFAFAAYASLTEAARGLRDGTYGYLTASGEGTRLARSAFDA